MVTGLSNRSPTGLDEPRNSVVLIEHALETAGDDSAGSRIDRIDLCPGYGCEGQFELGVGRERDMCRPGYPVRRDPVAMIGASGKVIRQTGNPIQVATPVRRFRCDDEEVEVGRWLRIAPRPGPAHRQCPQIVSHVDHVADQFGQGTCALFIHSRNVPQFGSNPVAATLTDADSAASLNFCRKTGTNRLL